MFSLPIVPCFDFTLPTVCEETEKIIESSTSWLSLISFAGSTLRPTSVEALERLERVGLDDRLEGDGVLCDVGVDRTGEPSSRSPKVARGVALIILWRVEEVSGVESVKA